MNLSESYKNKLRVLAGINESKESKPEFEYQIRDIDGPVFYKRKKGEDTWKFISTEDFAQEACSGKVIKWDESK